MKTCPWCEGKKVVGQMLRGEDAGSITLFGRKIPTVTMRDRPCPICAGTGQVSDEQYGKLTVPRAQSPFAGQPPPAGG